MPSDAPVWRATGAGVTEGGREVVVELVDETSGARRRVLIAAGIAASTGRTSPALYDGRPRPETAAPLRRPDPPRVLDYQRSMGR